MPLTPRAGWFAEKHRFGWTIAAMFAICFAGVLVGARTFYFRDFSLFGYPIAVHLKRSFWSGELPLWNPYNNCGLPFLAQWNTMVLYPGSHFIALFPLPWSVNVFCIAHLILGGFGMRRLVYKWTNDQVAADVAGLLFAFNGLALNFLMWPNNSAGWGWMPWVICELVKPKSLLRAVSVGAMQMLTGAPELILFTWTLGAVLGWRNPRHAFVAGLISACLAAPQLGPFFELWMSSHRAGGEEQIGEWALGANSRKHLFAPLAGGMPTEQGVYLQATQKWTSSYYFGIAAIAFAIAGLRQRKVWFLLALGVLCFTLAHGLASISLFRFPVKFVVPAVFCFVAMAGIGAAEIRKHKRLPLVGLIVAVMVPLVIYAGAADPNLKTNALTRSLFALVGVALIMTPKWPILLLTAFAADIASHMPWQNPTVAASAMQPKNAAQHRHFLTLDAYDELRGKMLSNPEDDLAWRRKALLQNLNLIDAVPKLDGFYSLYPMRERELRQGIYWSSPTNIAPLLDFLGVGTILHPEAEARSTAMPFVTGGQSVIFLREGEILRAITKPSFDPRRQLYLWNRLTNQITVATNDYIGPEAARLISSSAHEMEIEVTRSSPQFAVVAQSFDPNWVAETDAGPARTFRGNYNFIAIEVPKGAKTIRLHYRSSAFEGGLALAAGTLLFCCGLAWRQRAN